MDFTTVVSAPTIVIERAGGGRDFLVDAYWPHHDDADDASSFGGGLRCRFVVWTCVGVKGVHRDADGSAARQFARECVLRGTPKRFILDHHHCRHFLPIHLERRGIGCLPGGNEPLTARGQDQGGHYGE